MNEERLNAFEKRLSDILARYDSTIEKIAVLKAEGKTDRVIRQIDFAPTVAVVGGVRIPEQCEGAPAYQILKK